VLNLSLLESYNQQHHLVALFLYDYFQLKESCVFKGTLNSSIVHPREIFSIAVRENANAIIAVVNTSPDG
jgi:DNA repair protein RadC